MVFAHGLYAAILSIMFHMKSISLLLGVMAGCCSLGINGALAAPKPDATIIVPDGFKAYRVAENVGRGRHLVQHPETGVIYVSLKGSPGDKGMIAALTDKDADGSYETVAYFHDKPGTGIAIGNGYLYHGGDDGVVRRWKLSADSAVPTEAAEVIVRGLPDHRQHEAKSIALDGKGNLYVNIGAPSNACQESDRSPGSKGQMPCPLLETTAGVWRFKADVPNQTQPKDGHRYATGLRHCVALTWNPLTENLYAVPHGRDQLDSLWPRYFTAEDNAELPAEEFHLLKDGGNYGWPYTYWDPRKKQRVIAPEYGGNGERTDTTGRYEDPLVAFPGHWAPNSVVFYTGKQFPEKYHGGAFVAFHGSWNRAPLPQQGYNVAFVPFKDGKPMGNYSIFADNFAGKKPLPSPRDAQARPCGVAVGKDGSLLIIDSLNGHVWAVKHEGK